MHFCSMVLHCQKGGWQSAGKRIIEWMLLNEADEMMLILLYLVVAFFLPNPYSGSFWGPQSSFLPPSPPVGATCLILSRVERFIILSLLFPNYPCLPHPLPFLLKPQTPSGADLRVCHWEACQKELISTKMSMIATPLPPYRSTDMCSLKERFINLRECLNGGTSGSVTRSRMPG